MIALHGIGSRQDLPLPFELVVAGAGVTLVITFVLLLWAWDEPRFDREQGRPLPRLGALVDSRPWRWFWKAAAAALVGLAGIALIAGVDRIDNPVFGFVFVWVWVGLVPVSLVLGQVWRMTNPVRSLLRVARVRPGRPAASVYPAAIALAAFSFFELIQPDRATLHVLRVWVAAWIAWLLIGAIVRGMSWVGSADPFEVYASTIARLSLWGRTSKGVLMLTSPLRHLGTWRAPAGLAAVCLVLLGGTAYDSFSNVLWWMAFVQDSAIPRPVLGTLGLVAMIALVSGLYFAGVVLMRLPGRSLASTADLLAPGLVPIVAGYALAHYGTLLWLEGQRTAIQFSDPLGRGWDLFGTAELGVNTAIIGWPTLIAVLQVVFIVGGHVCGVIVSHDIAIRYLPAEGGRFGRQFTGQIGLLAAMVCYTVGGLVLLFA